MSTDSPVSEVRPRDAYSRVGRVFAILLALTILLLSLTEIPKLEAAGVSAEWVYGAIGFAGLALLVQLPFLYEPLPHAGRGAAHLLIVASFIVWAIALTRNAPAWEASPRGKKEVADRVRRDRERQIEKAAEAKDAAEREKTAQSLAELEANQKKLEEINTKLEACFAFGHHLDALEERVKDSLHNPDAFEHVETVLTVPDSDSNNVVMRFRAENGFGAIRTGYVRAQLIADDCSVQNITEATVD